MLTGGCFGSVQVGRCTAPSVGDSDSVAQDDFAAGRADGAADPLLPVGRGPRASPRGHPLPQREGTAGGEVGSVELPLALACLSSGTGWPWIGSERLSGPCSLRRRARWFSNDISPFYYSLCQVLGAMRKAGFSCEDVKDMGSVLAFQSMFLMSPPCSWVFNSQLWTTYAIGRGR